MSDKDKAAAKKKGRPTTTAQIKALNGRLDEQAKTLDDLSVLYGEALETMKGLGSQLEAAAKANAAAAKARKSSVEIEYIKPGGGPDLVKAFKDARDIERGLFEDRIQWLESQLEDAKEAAASAPEPPEKEDGPPSWIVAAAPLVNKLIDKGVALAELHIVARGGSLGDLDAEPVEE